MYAWLRVVFADVFSPLVEVDQLYVVVVVIVGIYISTWKVAEAICGNKWIWPIVLLIVAWVGSDSFGPDDENIQFDEAVEVMVANGSKLLPQDLKNTTVH